MENLKKICILPTWRIEVSQKIVPNTNSHKVYWEWITTDGKRSQVLPKNKIGKWQLFVDVISPEKVISSFEATEDDLALEKLRTTIENSGLQTNEEEFSIDLQNGILKFSIVRLLTDEGFTPQMKLSYSDNDDFYCSIFEMNLETTENLKQIGEMLLLTAQKMKS